MSYAIVDGIIVWVETPGALLISRLSDSASIEPVLILGYEASREGRNVTHDLLDGSTAMTLINPRLRSGTLRMLFDDENAAHNAVQFHSTSDTYVLETPDRFTLNMEYVAGTVGIALDDATREAWVVSVDFQEVDV